MAAARMVEAVKPWDRYAGALRDLRERETLASVDGDLVGHEDRVARSARDLAAAVGLPSETVERITVAARYHDVGKLRIDPAVLRKPGLLTPGERAEMERHAEIGRDMLSAIPGIDPMMVDVAAYHHERFDGMGYAGLAGEDIPLAARIVSVADVHDALVQKRCYKPAMAEAEALMLMISEHAFPRLGRDAFDPALLRAFVTLRLADPAFGAREDARLAETGDPDRRADLSAFAQSPIPSAGPRP